MTYLGVDIGFSASVRSTGICVLRPGLAQPVACRHVRTGETLATIAEMLGEAVPTAVSIDGPLVPTATKAFRIVNRYRDCERLLSGGIFQKRCKPGPTNSPRGQALHRQATLVARVLAKRYPGMPIFEAFPNAFLGVMLPNQVFKRPIRRGIKSDVFWLFAVQRSRLMKTLLADLFPAEDHSALYRACARLDDHDERAAFICAVTARAAHLNKSFLVHSPNDGAIALAPGHMVQSWASEVLGLRLGLTAPAAVA